MKNVMTVRVDPKVKKRLEKLARATARTKSFLVADAIEEYLRINEWHIEAIEKGILQAENGSLTPHEEVRKKWEAKLADPMD
ncbi:MAG: ribbon-helix-helix protein, CopG family [Candidatus Eremiobacteraeota bacterium]|nr:ribbon-helix-helix protein, CopG family [Candidatus Eremiobacteraeota bacterium]